jgi:hypothetical protein
LLQEPVRPNGRLLEWGTRSAASRVSNFDQSRAEDFSTLTRLGFQIEIFVVSAPRLVISARNSGVQTSVLGPEYPEESTLNKKNPADFRFDSLFLEGARLVIAITLNCDSSSGGAPTAIGSIRPILELRLEATNLSNS